MFGDARAGHPLSERPEFPAYVFLKWLVYHRKADADPENDDDFRVLPSWFAHQANRLHLRSPLAWPVTTRTRTSHAARHVFDSLTEDHILRREIHHTAELPKYRWREPITRGTWTSFQNLREAADGRFDVAFAVHRIVERFGEGTVDADHLREAYVGRNGTASRIRRWFRRKNPDAPPHWEDDVIHALTRIGALKESAADPTPTDLGLTINHWFELFAYSVGYQPDDDATTPMEPEPQEDAPTRALRQTRRQRDRKH